jgi:hypothetical protein
MYDAHAQSACDAGVLGSYWRCRDENQLFGTGYADLPYPENQPVSLAHSLFVGIWQETAINSAWPDNELIVGVLRVRL